MQNAVQDLRYAVRMLVKTPAFTVVALLTLALGIGANTAIFSVVHAVLLQQLPFSEPDQLYAIWTRHTSTDRYPLQVPEFCDYRDQNQTLASVSGFASWNANVTGGEQDAERLIGLRVSGNFFEMLGVRATRGRIFTAADDTPGQEKVVVISHGLWQRRFGGDPGIVGQGLTLNGEKFTVVGVLPLNFFFPALSAELAIPLAPDADPWRHNRSTTNFIRIIARAKPGVVRKQIEDDLSGIAKRLQAEFPKSYARKTGVLVAPYHEEITRNFNKTLWVLLGAVSLVLLIACANLANLMLVRAAGRRKEIAIRQALGASRARLARQLLTECALLSLAGGLLGMVFALWGVPSLVALSPAAMPRANQIGLSLPVLGFTAGISVVAGLLFGLLPAFRATPLGLGEELKAESRGGGGGKERSRIRGWIVAGEVAVMVVLLTGAGLLLRSFRELQRVEPGFDGAALTLRLSLPRKDYNETEKMSRFYRELEQRVATLPGVQVVAAANQIPLNGALASGDFKVADQPPVSEDKLPTAQYRMVTPGFFRAMNIPLLAGRTFDENDTPGRPVVGIISETLAKQNFTGRDPVGLQILMNDGPDAFRPFEIIGVVGDVRHGSLEEPPTAHFYAPYHQTNRALLGFVTSNQYLIVRAQGDAMGLAQAVRRELQAVDPNVAAANIRTTGDYLLAAAAPRRFNLLLVSIFAGLALLMAAIGIYGVLAYSVAQRTREIGLRLALGAQMADIRRLVLGEGLKLTLAGIAAGLAGAFALSRVIQSLLFRVKAADPLIYGLTVLLLVAISLVACWIPARRAAGVNPLTALRNE